MTETERCIAEINSAIGEIKTDIAVIKTKLNGGPGMTPWCLEHKTQLESYGQRLASIESKVFRWAGGLTAVMIVLQIGVPVLLKVVFK